MRIVPGRAQNLPGHAAQFEPVARGQRTVKAEALALLARGLVAQRIFIPHPYLVRLGRGNGDVAAVARFQRGVAAAVIRMQVGIHHAFERTARQRVLHHRQRLRHVDLVPAVDQRRGTGTGEQDIVRRQPAALEHVHGVGKVEALAHFFIWNAREIFANSIRTSREPPLKVVKALPVRTIIRGGNSHDR